MSSAITTEAGTLISGEHRARNGRVTRPRRALWPSRGDEIGAADLRPSARPGRRRPPPRRFRPFRRAPPRPRPERRSRRPICTCPSCGRRRKIAVPVDQSGVPGLEPPARERPRIVLRTVPVPGVTLGPPSHNSPVSQAGIHCRPRRRSLSQRNHKAGPAGPLATTRSDRRSACRNWSRSRTCRAVRDRDAGADEALDLSGRIWRAAGGPVFEAAQPCRIEARLLPEPLRHLRHREIMGDGERGIGEPGQGLFGVEALRGQHRAAGRATAPRCRREQAGGVEQRHVAQGIRCAPDPLPSTKLMQPKKALLSVRITPFGRPDVPDVFSAKSPVDPGAACARGRPALHRLERGKVGQIDAEARQRLRPSPRHGRAALGPHRRSRLTARSE